MAKLKAVKRKDLVVGKTYYDVEDAMFRDKMVYQGMIDGSIAFTMDEEDFKKSGYTKKDGTEFITFNKKGDNFYEEIEEVSSKTLAELQKEIRKENRKAYLRNRR